MMQLLLMGFMVKLLIIMEIDFFRIDVYGTNTKYENSRVCGS